MKKIISICIITILMQQNTIHASHNPSADKKGSEKRPLGFSEKLKFFKEENEILKEENTKLVAENIHLNDKCEQYKKENESLKKEIKELKETVDKFQKQIDSVIDSKKKFSKMFQKN